MHLQNELIVVYFAVTYCIGLIGLVLTFDNITSHADRVQAVAVAAASPLVPPALALAICLIVAWVLSAPLRWLSGYFLKAGMELLHPVRLQKKVSSIWHPSSL